MNDVNRLKPGAREGLQAALDELKASGIPHTVNSTLRTRREQEALYAKRATNPYPVARPGTSRHEQGKAADLGIPSSYRDRANAILSKHGWKWHGPSDAVHYDYKGALDAADAGVDASLGKYEAGIQSFGKDVQALLNDPRVTKHDGQDDLLNDPRVTRFESVQPQTAPDVQPAPEEPGVWDRLKNYGHNVFGNSGKNLYERFNAGVAPIGEALDWASNGAVKDVMQHTWDPLYAGAKQVLRYGQEQVADTSERLYNKYMNGDSQRMIDTANRLEYYQRAGIAKPEDLEWLHQHAYQIENARRPVMQLRALWPGGPNILPGLADGPSWDDKRRDVVRSVARAYSGEQDPSLPQGGLFSIATGQNNWLAQSLDILSDWKAAGKFGEMTIEPILGGSPRLAGALGKLEGKGGTFGSLASKLQPAAEGGLYGLGRQAVDLGANKLWEASRKSPASPGLRNLAEAFQYAGSAGEDFRKGQQIVSNELGDVRSGQTRLSRIHGMISSYSDRLAKEGVNVRGNAFENTQWFKPELADRFQGNLVDQFVDLYAEGGGEGSFFTKPEVLKLAADRGIDPAVIMKIGDTAVDLHLHAGNRLVDAGLMDPKAFAGNAGQYTRRLYQMSQITPELAGTMLQDLVRRGVTDTDTVALLQNIAMKGESPGQFFNKFGIDPQKVVRERVLDTPEERLNYLPELSYIKSSTRGVVGQLRAAAAARMMSQFADHEAGISAAAKALVNDFKRPAVLDQASFKGEMLRVTQGLKESVDHLNRPDTGLNAQLEKLKGRLDKANAVVAHYGQAKVQHGIAEPIEPEMPQPRAVKPATRTWKDFVKGDLAPSFKDTAADKIGKRFGAQKVAASAGPAREAISATLEKQDLARYAKDLNDWKKAHAAWQEQGAKIDEQFQVANARRQRAAVEADVHEQAVDAAKSEAERLTRRKELLEGSRPADIGDAADSLQQAMKKLDPQGVNPMPPDAQAYWHKQWLDQWHRLNTDIFSDIPPTGLPRVPPGMPADIINAMGQNNPLIATALNNMLSVDANAIAVGSEPPGWVNWGEGYGAMSNRFASKALKSFIDDALDPARFFGEARGPTAGLSKWLGEGLRTLKLYLNPSTHAAIYVQSFFEGYATVADAGMQFDPLSYKAGMKEWGQWKKGGEATPAVKAILDYGNDMGGSFRTGVDPLTGKAAAPGELNALQRLKEFGKGKFVEVQQFPKAGVVKVLMDQGMSGPEAAAWAEKGYGGSGIVQGGIETPGVMKLLENLNRSGVAMFTSYPLHSINRIAQLLVTNPEVALQYPVLRKYLVSQSPEDVQQQDREGKIPFSKAPLPVNTLLGGIFKNRDNTPDIMDLNNLTAHGGAFQDFRVTTVIDGWRKYQDAVARGEKSGLNPIDQGNANASEFLKQMGVPSVSKILMLANAVQNRPTSPFAAQAMTPLQAAGGLIGIPSSENYDPLKVRFVDALHQPVRSRQVYTMEYEEKVREGLVQSNDFNGFLDDKDILWLRGAYIAGAQKLDQIQKDKTIKDADAYKVIRNQLNYLHQLQLKMDAGGAALTDREIQLRALAVQQQGEDNGA